MNTANPRIAAETLPRNIGASFQRQQARALELRSSTLEDRLQRVRALRDALLRYRDAITEAAHEDFRRPPPEVELTEIYPVIGEANEALRKLRRWMKPQKASPTRAMLGTRAQVRYEPRGVCLILSPWNYPVTLTIGPLISALAAGNTAIIKPSEMTPHLSAVIRRMLEETFDPDDVAVFEGDADVASALLDQPFDHVFFTGSPQIGKVVMQAAARHLSSVTLELGGKSPVIVDRDADLDKAARNIAWAKFTNCGQTCIAPDYLYVENSIRDEFLKRLGAQIDSVFGADPMRSPDYARIVNRRHFDRVLALLDDARRRGAQVLCGGQAEAAENYIAPTVLTGVAPDATVMHEEIFGPLLPVQGFSDIEQPIRDINARPKPLAMYLYGRSRPRLEQLIQRTSAGGTCINHSVVHFLHHNLPFGGVNNSGIGSSHGIYGFKAFSHERALLKDHFSTTHWMFPPYTDRVQRLIRLATRWLS